jgi:hypothetical protein
MVLETSVPRSRRAILAAAAGAAAATAAAAMTRPLDVSADDGDPLILGQPSVAQTETSISAEPSPHIFPGAVLRLAANDNGTGLSVFGKVKFTNRSGRVTVPAGRSSVDVDLRPTDLPFHGLEGTPLCFANVMSHRPGVFVTNVRPNHPVEGKIRIYLNRSAPSPTYVAWLVLN